MNVNSHDARGANNNNNISSDALCSGRSQGLEASVSNAFNHPSYSNCNQFRDNNGRDYRTVLLYRPSVRFGARYRRYW